MTVRRAWLAAAALSALSFDIDKETDWRIESSVTSSAAFSRMAANPYFNP